MQMWDARGPGRHLQQPELLEWLPWCRMDRAARVAAPSVRRAVPHVRIPPAHWPRTARRERGAGALPRNQQQFVAALRARLVCACHDARACLARSSLAAHIRRRGRACRRRFGRGLLLRRSGACCERCCDAAPHRCTCRRRMQRRCSDNRRRFKRDFRRRRRHCHQWHTSGIYRHPGQAGSSRSGQGSSWSGQGSGRSGPQRGKRRKAGAQ